MLSLLALAGALAVTLAVPDPADAASRLQVVSVVISPEGKDPDTNAGRNEEVVSFVNPTSLPLDLRGWSVRDEFGLPYRFPARRLAAGARVRLHTGIGDDTATDLYWDVDRYVWNNSGDTVTLRTPGGSVADTCSWDDDPDDGRPVRCR